MELFSISIQPNTIFYKGSKDIIGPNIMIEPMWLGKLEVAKAYGKHIYEFKTESSLKMINLHSGIFRLHFMDMLNLKYMSNNREKGHYDVPDRVKWIMSTLGLPDNETMIGEFGQPTCKYEGIDTLDKIKKTAPYYGKGERNSIRDLDREMANELYDIYGRYGFDGYIAPYATPTRFECGWFNDEVCVFNPISVLSCTQFKKTITKQKGGNTIKFTPYGVVYDPNHNTVVNNPNIVTKINRR
jgi:hypothetical protein